MQLLVRLALHAALALAAFAAATVAPAGAATVPSGTSACWAGGASIFDVDWSTGSALRGGEREPAAWKDPPIGEAPTVTRRAAQIPVYFRADGGTSVGQ